MWCSKSWGIAICKACLWAFFFFIFKKINKSLLQILEWPMKLVQSENMEWSMIFDTFCLPKWSFSQVIQIFKVVRTISGRKFQHYEIKCINGDKLLIRNRNKGYRLMLCDIEANHLWKNDIHKSHSYF